MNQLLKKDFIKKVQRVGDVIPCNVVINVVLICACNSTGNTIQCLINCFRRSTAAMPVARFESIAPSPAPRTVRGFHFCQYAVESLYDVRF